MGHNDLGDFYYARGDLQVRGTALRPACVPSIGLHFHHLLTGAARTRPMCQTPHTLRCFSRLCRSDACSATSVPQAISPPANPDSPPCNFPSEYDPVCNVQNAFKCYVRTRDYCTTPQAHRRHVPGRHQVRHRDEQLRRTSTTTSRRRSRRRTSRCALIHLHN